MKDFEFKYQAGKEYLVYKEQIIGYFKTSIEGNAIVTTYQPFKIFL